MLGHLFASLAILFDDQFAFHINFVSLGYVILTFANRTDQSN